MIERVVRGPLLVPREDGSVDFCRDGALGADRAGLLEFVGDYRLLQRELPADLPVRDSQGVILPPLVDIHIHIPQHPIRGRFVEGVPDDAPGGKLLAGLKRNVFPAEQRCDDPAFAEQVTHEFLADTLSHGVVGGSAYVTPSPVAAEAALRILPSLWSAGLVMMNQNCPEGLRTREASYESDITHLARAFGNRLVITDRFAVAVATPLRRRGVALAKQFGLRTQTHLNEQIPEKEFVEKVLYPNSSSYTDVYREDGLLDYQCILAHCIHMTDDEWRIVRDTGSVIAHCPTSNLLLGSGRMDLDRVKAMEIPYAIATDVGASPTVSMLAEMARFLCVHEGFSVHATPQEALFRATLAPAAILGIESHAGRLEPGCAMSFIEVEPRFAADNVDDVIRSLLPENIDAPSESVRRVTVAGSVQFERTT